MEIQHTYILLCKRCLTLSNLIYVCLPGGVENGEANGGNWASNAREFLLNQKPMQEEIKQNLQPLVAKPDLRYLDTSVLKLAIFGRYSACKGGLKWIKKFQSKLLKFSMPDIQVMIA